MHHFPQFSVSEVVKNSNKNTFYSVFFSLRFKGADYIQGILKRILLNSEKT